MSLITTVKLDRCIIIILIFIILFQISVFHSNNLKSQKYYIGEPVIANIDVEQTILFADPEVWKRNLKRCVNYIHLLYYLKFILISNLSFFLPIREVVVDIKKIIFSFTLAYFSGSKYKSTYAYC